MEKHLARLQRLAIPFVLLSLVFVLSGCSNPFSCLFGCPSLHVVQQNGIKPLNTAHIPHVVVEEIDRPPLQPAKWGIAALSMLADKIDASIVPGQDGIEVFIGAITSKSVQYGLLAFHVPPIPPDTAKPVLQVRPSEADAGETPTHFANRAATCQQANTTALSSWQVFHHL